MTSQTARLNDALLKRFMHGFYGYGNLHAPFWFVGMEEGGGKSFDEIATRLRVWQMRGEKLTEDVMDYHVDIGMPDFFYDKIKLQPTWAKLIRVLLGL
ncbi:MAG: hypothetical protein KC519_14970, partial [Anaerolineae bacterium]|nr:hypothetical protein [Anaerolineae bacterium]